MYIFKPIRLDQIPLPKYTATRNAEFAYIISIIKISISLIFNDYFQTQIKSIILSSKKSFEIREWKIKTYLAYLNKI